MKKIIYLLVSILLINCVPNKYAYKKTEKLEVRQLINKKIINKIQSASYFLIVGSYDSSEKRKDVIKSFVKVGNSYTLFKCDLEDLNINIHNKDEKPYFIIENERGSAKSDYEMVKEVSTGWYYHYKITLYCNEKYLPEKLLPVKLE